MCVFAAGWGGEGERRNDGAGARSRAGGDAVVVHVVAEGGGEGEYRKGACRPTRALFTLV